MAPSPDFAFAELQRAVAGRFSLEGELGRGGMGIVFLARDVLLERAVAIKLLAPDLATSANMRDRFVREARLAAQCFHPHIVPIHEVAESGALAWFVMAYVRGETLADRLRRMGPLPPSDVQRIAREIGWALAYAHDRGVVHRDIKPENILLEAGSGRALLADFGIAFDANVTGEHSGAHTLVPGTARYMAPEQAMGHRVDGRADLYALGVTLHIAATGSHPFGDRPMSTALMAGTTLTAPPIRGMAPHLPPALGEAIDKCLAPVASQRFSTAGDFVQCIEQDSAPRSISPDVLTVREHARSATSLLWWTLAIGVASTLLVAGEAPRTLGRAMMIGAAQTVLSFSLIGCALLSIETLRAARRAMRRGTAAWELEAAFVQDPLGIEAPASHTSPRSLIGGAVAVTGAAAMAIAQGSLPSSPFIPEFASGMLQAVLLLAPPIVMHLGLTSLWNGSAFTRRVGKRIGGILSAGLGRWFGATGAASTMPSTATYPLVDAPTEIRLGKDAEAILARLPESLQKELPLLRQTVERLATQAELLRRRDAALVGLAEMTEERRAVRTRLSTTIAALETVRLDLRRLESTQTLPGDLTESLEVLRDLQRHVDAVAEVRRTLRLPSLTPSPTPV